ncbi:MAG: YwqG family protein [Corynebacterium sp.]|nr:YwqG family protein [Corynebacterium sp.]
MSITDVYLEPMDSQIEKYEPALRSLTRPTTMLRPHPVVAPTLEALLNAAEQNPAGSRIGGPGLVSAKHPWPSDPSGLPMYLVAQLNLAEFPPQPDLPSDGLLQFFTEEDPLGLFELKPVEQIAKLVRYIPAVDVPTMSLEFHAIPEFALVSGGYFEITASPYDQYPVFSDTSFTPDDMRLLRQVDLWDEHPERLDEFLNAQHATVFNGGWARFVQSDPRDPDTNLSLLLQIDVYDFPIGEVNLEIADSGILNYFIPTSDLRTLNFHNVHYHWDSY